MEKNNLSITVDVEDWYHIPSVCGSPFSTYRDVDEFFKDWDYKYDFLTIPTRRALDILDEFNLVGTFFIVADVASRYPGLVETIADRGHEIACHGLFHNCKIHPETKEALMTTSEFEGRTREAKKALENISKEKVIGYRAPNALIAGWMLEILEKVGFKYDSSVSVNSLFNKTDSPLTSVSSYPYNPKINDLEAGKSREFVEFPWPYYDVGIKIPVAGGPFLRFLGSHIIIKGLEQSLKRGNTIFYFHPIDISSEKFPSIGCGRPFYWQIKGKTVERNLRKVLRNFKNINKQCLRDIFQDHHD